MGGYLVLVKVCKGKVYEPRHWFSLAGFEIGDVPEEEGVYHVAAYFRVGSSYCLLTWVRLQRYCHVRSVCPAWDIISKWQRLVSAKRMFGCPLSANH
jgi:hypothetical protein